MSTQPLVNRVANSGLVTLTLEEDYPQHNMIHFDLKDHLFQELILKEKDFRTALKEHDWTQYQDAILLVHCSTDAIIPVWAYMLVTAYAEPYAHQIYQGSQQAYLDYYYNKIIQERDYSEHEGARIVIKGCSNRPVPPSAYLALTTKLRPYAQSIMYGEPCSTVPIFKRPRVLKKD